MRRLVLTLAVVFGAAIWLPASAHAAFGFDELGVSFSAQAGSPETQAGSHPFTFTTSFEANTDGEDTDGRLKDLFLDLPPGLLFDPTATPRCLETDFATLDEGFNDCPDATAVGAASAAVGEAGDWSIAPVFNLAPHAGEVVRLGLRVGGVENIVVSGKPDLERPHEMTLEIEGFPEAVELFGLELHLWGVPADPGHDDLRGRCAGPDGSLGSCPVAIAQQPLLTLPTRCGEPLELFYLAESWDEALADGEAETAMGLTGCGALGFAPELLAQPTTEAAQSPTGLLLSLGFDDEGLGDPAGFAQSQLSDLVLALPEGMKVDPSAAEGLGICAETDFDDEGPEELEGEGCPDSSTIGSLEVESPLLGEDALAGAVYLGAPLSELAKGSAIELYAVARNPTLGIVLKQLVEVEPDPETGQLVVYAEGLPQLPFSRLDVDLFDGEDSPLVSPPRCGDYEIAAGLTPWAEGSQHGFLSEFSLDTGPGGGPCPSNEAVEPPGEDASPAADPVPAVVTIPPPVIRLCPRGRGTTARSGVQCFRRCPKGKRLVRDNGKRRCIRRCRSGKRLVRRRGKARCVRKVRHRRHGGHRRQRR